MKNVISVACGAFCLLLMTSCSSTIHAVNFKIHTEPEGAHIVYQQENRQWVYLGTSPLDVVEPIDPEQLGENYTISIKAMRCGYLDQTKEWQKEEFEQELNEKGQLFWTPRLIKANP